MPPSETTLRFCRLVRQPLDQVTGQQVGVARLDHGHPLEHLPDDDLDVLVVDRRTLGAVHRLHLVHQVLLHPTHPEHPQHVLRIRRAGRQLLTDPDPVAVLDQQPRPAADRELGGLGAVVRGDDDLLQPVGVLDLDPARRLGDRRLALGLTRLEQLLDARQTLGDVVTGHTTGVEGPHRQLGARLADGLRGDDADGLADVDQLAAGQRPAVAHRAGAAGRLTGEDAAHLDLADAVVDQQPDVDVTEVDPGRQQHLAVGAEHVGGQGPGVDRGLDVLVEDQPVTVARRSRWSWSGHARCRSPPRG